MPTYEYICRASGHLFEIVQSMKDDQLTECPECGGALRKVFAPPAISFKGSGFYATDHRQKAKSSSSEQGGEKKKEQGGEKTTESASGSGSGSGSGDGKSSGSKDSSGSSSPSSSSSGSESSSGSSKGSDPKPTAKKEN